jgi:hypothetical protein
VVIPQGINEYGMTVLEHPQPPKGTRHART